MNTQERRSATAVQTTETNIVSVSPEAVSKAISEKNTSFLSQNMDAVADKSLNNELAFQMAGTRDADGNPVKGQMGGYPKQALLNCDKFENMTPTELAIELLKSKGNAFAVFGVEEDLVDAENKRTRAEGQFEKLKNDGYREDTDEGKESKSILDKLAALRDKIKKVTDTLDKGSVLDTAIATKNLLTPDRIKFFKEGVNKIEINQDELITKLLAAGYSSSSLRGFVEEADNGSLSPQLGKKLAQYDETMLGDMQNLHPEKFQ